MTRSKNWADYLLWGWVSATVIALAGSVSEIVSGGGVCPTSGGGSVRGAASESMLGTGIPLCFVSLAMLVVILGLFVMGPYKRTCDTCNIPA